MKRLPHYITPLLLLAVGGILYAYPFATSNSPGGWAGLEVLAIIIAWILPSIILNFTVNLFTERTRTRWIVQLLCAIGILIFYFWYASI